MAASISRLPQATQKGYSRCQDAKGSAGDVKVDRYQNTRVAGVAFQVQKPKVIDEMDKPRTLNTAAGARKVPAKVSRRASAARVRRTTLLLRQHQYDDEVSRVSAIRRAIQRRTLTTDP